MNVIDVQIEYHPTFKKQLNKLPVFLQQRVIKAKQLLCEHPFHTSLRLHPLKGSLHGLWSISLSANLRIIFKKMDDGTIVFLTIGTHDIYRLW